MRKLLLFSVAGLAVVTLVTTAKAGLIDIKVQEDAGPVQTFAFGSNFSLNGVVLPDFQVNNFTGSTVPSLALPSIFDTNSLNITNTGSGTPHVLNIWVTAHDLTSGFPDTISASLQSVFTTNEVPAGWSVQEASLWSPSNALFSGLALDSASFGPPGPGTSVQGASFALTGNTPFSLTAHYTVNSNGSTGDVNSTINMDGFAITRQTVGVPGPVVGAGLPGLVTLLGGLGGVWWKKKRRQRA